MVKIGEFRPKRFERISFRDWIIRGYARSGRYPVRVIFPPNRFPSFTIIFEDSERDFEVRMSLQAEKFKEALKALGLQLKKADLPALVVEIQADEHGVIYGLDVANEEAVQLVWRGAYWRRWQSQTWEDKEEDELTKRF
jgi:hypothetical protein